MENDNTLPKKSQLQVLLKKNFLLWKRNTCCSIMEILLPVIICSFLFIIRGTTDVIDLPQLSYYKKIPIPGFPDMPNYFYPTFPTTESQKQALLPDHLKINYKVDDFPVKIKNCLTGSSKEDEFRSYRNGHIAISPENQFTQQLATIIKSIFIENDNYKVKFYDNQQSVDDYIGSDNYEEDICFAIDFESTGETNNQWKYGLHFNTTGNPATIETPIFGAEEYLSYKVSNIDSYYTPWVQYGFLQVQIWIDNLILKAKTGFNAGIGVETSSIKTDKQSLDPLTVALNGQLRNYIVSPMIILYLRMTYQILMEKEKKIKEGMKIMGLKSSAFYLSWIIQYLCSYTVTSLLMSLILKATVYPNSDFTLILVWMLIYSISLIFQSLFMQTFFTRSKVGTLVSSIVYLGYSFLLFAISPDSNVTVKRAVSIFSQGAMGISADVFFLIEAKNQGIGWGNLDLIIEQYSVGISLYMMVINIFLFGLLALYLDQIFPNEFGKKLHPLFCIPYFRKKRPITAIKEELLHKKQAYVEEVDASLEQKEKDNDILVLKNIVKQYPNGKIAVNNLSLKMYKDQISCLLGHNGSGKSTTFSMLNGMQEFTQGEGTAYGLDITTEMDELRTMMGVCPQHDILFDQLTCKEHLELYAALKGVPKNNIDQQVIQLLDDVDLTFKKNEQTKTLSGGQKRRLSVAIAFIGGSKLVYLDEPTSGCDTSARRHIWEMLRKYKQNKIVLLTTHFMDEAEFLGDRIAIIGNGKLICHGSPLYLKSQFGIGYNLTIIKKKATDENQCINECVQNCIPNAKLLSEVSSEIQYQLKMEDIHLFEQLFDSLEENKEKFNILNYGVSITSMEEVFLKVADMGEDIDLEELNQEEQLKNKSQVMKNKDDQLKRKIDDFDIDSIREQNESKIFCIHLMALIKKRLIYFKRDYKGLICEVLIPCLLVLLGLILMSQDFVVQDKKYTLSPELYDNKQLPLLYGGYRSSDTVSKIMGNLDKNYFDIEEFKVDQSSQSYYEVLKQFDDANFQKADPLRKGGVFFSNVQNSLYQYYLQVDTANKNVLPYYVNQVNEAINRQVYGDNSLGIEVTVNSLALTKKLKNLENVGDGFVAALVFSTALAFIPSSLIIFTVKEREDQIKHQQIVSGISITSYWISNFIVDYLKYAFSTMAFCIVMISVFNINTFTDDADVYVAIVLLFVLYGSSIINFSYVFGFVFKEFGNAQIASFFLHFLLGSILPIIVFIFRIIESTKTLGEILQWVLRFFPSFAFGDGVLSIGSRELIGGEKDEKGNRIVAGAFEMGVAGGDIIYLALTSIMYYCIIFIIERLIYRGSLDKLLNKSDKIQYTPKLLDDDVQAEQNKVKVTQPKDYTVRVSDLRKIYKISSGYLEAVDKVSFGIENGECFTLLGVNGAGKSTTFKMLSGDIQPTEGEIHIQNYNVLTEMDRARQYIGYCPQFDALIDNLTAQEHLELYCAIKRIPAHLRENLIEQKLVELDLMKFKNVIAGTYSGGNKRKLSVAIAMIGNPPIVFLDEPSTGMDPKARRYMWSVISKISTERKRSSIILTTHMMEEAEALSTRIAIMVKGQLKCLGSIQHIKNKFGKGYEVELVLSIPTKEEKLQRVQTSNKDLNQKIKQHELTQTLDDLKQLGLESEITEDGIGSSIHQALRSQQGLSMDILIEFIIIQERGANVQEFIQNNMGAYTIIEQFSAFYRFKIETIVNIGKIFGLFQSQKEELYINSYSVKQATIEQIFNMFAKDEIDTKLYNNINFEIKDDQQNLQSLGNQSQRPLNNDQNASLFQDVELQNTNI